MAAASEYVHYTTACTKINNYIQSIHTSSANISARFVIKGQNESRDLFTSFLPRVGIKNTKNLVLEF